MSLFSVLQSADHPSYKDGESLQHTSFVLCRMLLKRNEAKSDVNVFDSQVPGPCDPEDLLDGVVFGAKYLGSTQLKSEKTPSTNARMAQAQEAVDRIKVNSNKRLSY